MSNMYYTALPLPVISLSVKSTAFFAPRREIEQKFACVNNMVASLNKGDSHNQVEKKSYNEERGEAMLPVCSRSNR